MSGWHFNLPWAAALLSALGWTTVFSLVQPPLRGLRNLGILASYGVGIAMAIQAPWRESLVTWAAFGLAGGVGYLAYEAWSSRGEGAGGDRLSFAPLLHGVVAWPIMLPEAAEYALAELGVLKPPPANGAPAAGDPSTPAAPQ